MQENSTLNILKRIGFVLWIFLLWQIMSRVVFATGIALWISFQNGLSYYGAQAPQPNWWLNVWNYIPNWSSTDQWWPILVSQLGGILVAAMVYYGGGSIIRSLFTYIMYGPAPKGSRPACADEKCTCAKHKADTFVDGVWVKSICTDEHCTCKKFHFKQIFKLKKQQWVKVH